MARKIKKYKVGLDSETYKISMVSQPAIEEDFIALKKQDEVEIKLSSDERHICYGPALIPNKDIYRNNGENEYYINFTEESIVKMSQEFLKDYKQHEVNLQHEDNADEVFVCESWIVEDPYRDKANALGFNVPKGTWMVAMKVNNIEVWDRVKSGELKGFSVESMISLEEFEKQNNNDMIETNDMKFWSKMKEVLGEVFASVTLAKQNDDIEPVAIEDLEEQTPQEPQETPQESVETPKVEDTPQEPQNEAVEPQESSAEQPQEETPTEEPKHTEEAPNDNHLEELINSLKEEIEALKKMNTGLDKKVKELSKMPSADPVNVNAKGGGVAASTYEAWREQMAKYI